MDLSEAINRFYFEGTVNELRLMHSDVINSTVSYNSLLYLDVIAYTEDCTVSKLASLFNVAKSAVTQKVQSLIRQNLVIKKQSQEDKRVFYLYVNQDVLKEYYLYNEVRNKTVDEIEKKYSQQEIDAFCDMLGILSDQFTQSVTKIIKE